MKHYIDPATQQIYAYAADGSEDQHIPVGFAPISKAAALAVVADRLNAIPVQVSMRQARLALLSAGLLSGVDALINAMPSPQKEASRIEWEYATTVDRDSPLVAALSLGMALDASALDALFAAAAAL